MMWYYGSGAGWSWLWMTLMMVVFFGGLIAVAVWAIRAGMGSSRDSDAMDVLRRRLAAGEISQEDFEKTRGLLQG
jgi:putative membrane protein